MTTLPAMGLVLPTRGAPGAGVWDDTIDADLGLLDAHDHTVGKGTQINTAALVIDADLSFHTLWAPTNMNRITFASITALSANNKSIFVNGSDNELYWRSNTGTNVKLTSGASLNVAAFTGGIGGDYTAVGAAEAFDDSNKRYTFKDGNGNWARATLGGVRLIEFGTTESLYVGLIAPATLAASYDVTLPLAAPGSTSLVQMSSTGVLTASNTVTNAITVSALITASAGVTCATNQHVTVGGTGLVKHGTRTMCIPLLPAGLASTFLPATTVDIVSPDTLLYVPISIEVGKRILVTRARGFDSATGPTKFAAALAASGSGVTGQGTASSGSGSQQTVTSQALNVTVATQIQYYIAVNVTTGSATCTITSVEVDYDQP